MFPDISFYLFPMSFAVPNIFTWRTYRNNSLKSFYFYSFFLRFFNQCPHNIPPLLAKIWNSFPIQAKTHSPHRGKLVPLEALKRHFGINLSHRSSLLIEVSNNEKMINIIIYYRTNYQVPQCVRKWIGSECKLLATIEKAFRWYKQSPPQKDNCDWNEKSLEKTQILPCKKAAWKIYWTSREVVRLNRYAVTLRPMTTRRIFSQTGLTT